MEDERVKKMENHERETARERSDLGWVTKVGVHQEVLVWVLVLHRVLALGALVVNWN